MSWKAAAELARDRASRARDVAGRHPVSQQSVRELSARMQKDPVVLVWLMTRLAQELEAVAAELEQRGREDVTVSERGPR